MSDVGADSQSRHLVSRLACDEPFGCEPFGRELKVERLGRIEAAPISQGGERVLTNAGLIILFLLTLGWGR